MAVLFMTTYLLIISFGQTKLEWYDAPIYPIAAIMIGLGLERCFEGICQFMKFRPVLKYIMFALFVLLIFGSPYMRIIDKVYHPSDNWDQVQYGYYLKEMARVKPDLKKYTVSDYGYNAHLLFYAKVLNYNDQFDIKINLDNDLQFSNGELVVTCLQGRMPEIEQKYDCRILYSSDRCKTYLIERKKQYGL